MVPAVRVRPIESRELNEWILERQGLTLGVHFTEMFVSKRCPLRDNELYSVFLMSLSDLLLIINRSYKTMFGDQEIKQYMQPG